MSAGGINGSPYHMRHIALCLQGESKCQPGQQDRSLQAAAIFVPPPTVSGLKYHDQNGNGANDTEPGLDSWTINAYLDDGNNGAGFTAADAGDGILSQGEFNAGASVTGMTEVTTGSFSLTLAADTDYVLCEELQTNWGQTEPNLGAVSGATVNDTPLLDTDVSAAVTGVLTLFRKDQKLRIETEHLQIGNGYADNASSPLPVDRGVDGSAADSHIQTTPISILRCGIDDSLGPDGYAITGAETGDTPDQVFGNFQHNTKSGRKYQDVDGDGTDTEDTGATVADGGTFSIGDGDLTVTDSSNFTVGDTIRIDDEELVIASIASPTLTLNTLATANHVDTTEVFIVNPDESGWVIRLYNDIDEDGTLNDGDTFVSQDVTLTDGTYTFSGLMPGKYIVCEVEQDDWQQTEPDNDVCINGPAGDNLFDDGHALTVDTSNEDHVGNDFGNMHLYSLLVITCDQTTGQVVLSDMKLAGALGGDDDTLNSDETGSLFGLLTDISITENAFNRLLCARAQYTDLTPDDYALGLEIPDLGAALSAPTVAAP